jgi:hypothetical protein
MRVSAPGCRTSAAEQVIEDLVATVVAGQVTLVVVESDHPSTWQGGHDPLRGGQRTVRIRRRVPPRD